MSALDISLGGLMKRLDPLNFVKASHENTRSVMDICWNNIKHPLHVAINSLTAR